MYGTQQSSHSPYFRCYDFEVGNRLTQYVTNVSGWSWEAYVRSPYSGEIKPKPGYVAHATRESCLYINVPASASYISILYSAFRGMGHARMSCIAPCACAETLLQKRVHAHDTTVTMHASKMHRLTSSSNTCVVRLTAAARHAFKFHGFRLAEPT